MKKIRNLVATFALAGIIMMGATSANAGFLVTDLVGGSEIAENNPCKINSDVKVNHGIIVSYNVGIIVSLTGIIVSYTDTSCE